MEDDTDLDAITPDFAVLFGFIIAMFAKLERQMTIAMAGLLDTDLGTAAILMSSAGFSTKRQTLHHINWTTPMAGTFNADLSALLAEIEQLTKVRNLIAHSIWASGTRPDSIRPMNIDTRGKKLKLVGYEHTERDYTVDDIRNEGRKIDTVQRRLIALLESSGLIAKVQANIDALLPTNPDRSPASTC